MKQPSLSFRSGKIFLLVFMIMVLIMILSVSTKAQPRSAHFGKANPNMDSTSKNVIGNRPGKTGLFKQSCYFTFSWGPKYTSVLEATVQITNHGVIEAGFDRQSDELLFQSNGIECNTFFLSAGAISKTESLVITATAGLCVTGVRQFSTSNSSWFGGEVVRAESEAGVRMQVSAIPTTRTLGLALSLFYNAIKDGYGGGTIGLSIGRVSGAEKPKKRSYHRRRR